MKRERRKEVGGEREEESKLSEEAYKPEGGGERGEKTRKQIREKEKDKSNNHHNHTGQKSNSSSSSSSSRSRSQQWRQQRHEQQGKWSQWTGRGQLAWNWYLTLSATSFPIRCIATLEFLSDTWFSVFGGHHRCLDLVFSLLEHCSDSERPASHARWKHLTLQTHWVKNLRWYALHFPLRILEQPWHTTSLCTATGIGWSLCIISWSHHDIVEPKKQRKVSKHADDIHGCHMMSHAMSLAHEDLAEAAGAGVASLQRILLLSSEVQIATEGEQSSCSSLLQFMPPQTTLGMKPQKMGVQR